MTLEEAIKHCEEKAEELEKRVKPYQCESINKKLYEIRYKDGNKEKDCGILMERCHIIHKLFGLYVSNKAKASLGSCTLLIS